MYLTSFAHRNTLFGIAERWLLGRPDPGDIRILTGILISDGFVVRETLEALSSRLLHVIYPGACIRSPISTKGELRDMICGDDRDTTERVAELFRRYRENPDYYYREAPINAVVCLDDEHHLLGSFRIKRPKRIAEKANRRIADWIFENVLGRAQEMARERARLSGIPLERFVTPAEEMTREFIRAEEFIAGSFRDGSIRLDKTALTIHDVGAIKIIADKDAQQRLEEALVRMTDVAVTERAEFSGNYQAVSLILEIPWDADHVCRRYRESSAWEKYQGRGISPEELQRGLEPFLADAETRINIELILSTFPDMVESELGSSMHEERIIAQRDNKYYKGYIPMNVEFLVESLFAAGFSPRIDIDRVPIKLWGRYLPETMSSYVRRLHNLPEHDFFH